MTSPIGKKMKNGIQSGEVTHHQDQVATIPVSVSFKNRKIKNTAVDKDIPVDVVFAIVCLF